MNCYSQIPSGIFVDGIKILTRPAENDFSEVIFSNDDIYLRNMRLYKNISVWFDAGVIIKKSQPRIYCSKRCCTNNTDIVEKEHSGLHDRLGYVQFL